MPQKNQLLPIIICGGSGSRLWPLSRRSFPKQYLKINPNNNYSFLQTTINRIKDLKNLLNPVIICNEEHRFITAEQLRELNIKPHSIILEPCSRNTAPAIASGALNCITNGYDPLLLVLPSDHQINNKDEFISSVENAMVFASDGEIITFGVKPKTASTSYGYIRGNKKFQSKEYSHCKIEKFIEKPSQVSAEKLFRDEYISWNSGIFMFRASTIIKELEKYSPDIILQCKESLKNKKVDLDFLRLERKSFEKCPDISIDNAVMEKTDLGYVFPLNAEWSDIGGWGSFWENSKKDSNKNVIIGDALQVSSKNSLICSYDRLTVALGIDDLIVIETNDAVLVAKKDQSENIKKLVNNLKLNNRIESEESKKVFRPWGNYISVEEDLNWKIKRIEVKRGASISLQLHNQRAEHWIVVKGIADIEINAKVFTLRENQSCFIPKGQKHRLSNSCDETLVIIEVQSGEYLGEDDIIRFEDKYGRN